MRNISSIPTTPTTPAEPKITSGSPPPTAPTANTAAAIPANVLHAWDKAVPVLGSPQAVAGNPAFVPQPGPQNTASPAALATPNELGVHAVTLPEWNQEYYKQLNEALDRLWAACTQVLRQSPGSMPKVITTADRQNMLRDVIHDLQSLAPNAPPDQQREINQVISQLQIACSLEQTPFGNPVAYLNQALSTLTDIVDTFPTD